MNIKPYLISALSHIPLIRKTLFTDIGGTSSARYCYAVWLRHLVLAMEFGMTKIPDSVMEIGPGMTIGSGLAALLSGSSHYSAVEINSYHHPSISTMDMLEELLALFKNRAAIPDQAEFPKLKPYLNHYRFPDHILSPSRMQANLSINRLEKIKTAIRQPQQPNAIKITRYSTLPAAIDPAVDFLFSQAVLEHVSETEHYYQKFYQFLKPQGLMAHQIDFKCHGITREWNAHYGYSARHWDIMWGKRPFILNRKLPQEHIDQIRKNHFNISHCLRFCDESPLKKENLHADFQQISDEDLQTQSLYVQAIKP
jgi:hypothetical protein